MEDGVGSCGLTVSAGEIDLPMGRGLEDGAGIAKWSMRRAISEVRSLASVGSALKILAYLARD